jgi:hypothetical protein
MWRWIAWRKNGKRKKTGKKRKNGNQKPNDITLYFSKFPNKVSLSRICKFITSLPIYLFNKMGRPWFELLF